MYILLIVNIMYGTYYLKIIANIAIYIYIYIYKLSEFGGL